MREKYFLVLDVGTTRVKAFVFQENLRLLLRISQPLSKSLPQKGWVEQDPKELFLTSANVLRRVVKESGIRKSLFAALGISNQRETTLLWDKKRGKPLYSAIVWEDVRSRKLCQKLKQSSGFIREKSGLALDPYFSAPKIHWILKNIKEAEKLLALNNLAFGTVDSWILRNFLKGEPHLTDYTNASRTLLFNIKTLNWEKALLQIFKLPLGILPQVKPSQSFFGVLKKEILGFPLPLLAVCGDQQASMYAAGVKVGTTKVTYGTGTFIMQVLGRHFSLQKPFFTTLIPYSPHPVYALEAKIACCGKKVEAVLNNPAKLKIIFSQLARKVDFYLKRLPYPIKELIVDGGVSRADYLIATQEKVSRLTLKRQRIFDGTALGVAKLLSQFIKCRRTPRRCPR